MKYLALIAVVCFIAIAGFGFVGMYSHTSAFMHCASLLSGSPACTNSIIMGFEHVQIYQGFSLSLLASVFLLLFAASCASLARFDFRIQKSAFPKIANVLSFGFVAAENLTL